MERTFSPMIRQFSAIDGLQKAYTLVYSMDTGNENGCCLTLCLFLGKSCFLFRFGFSGYIIGPEIYIICGYIAIAFLCCNNDPSAILHRIINNNEIVSLAKHC